jgi:hypothetical protein
MPYRTLNPDKIIETAETLQRRISERHLDYCSEMLSLCAKTAALYPQATKDSLVDSVVSELEQLTANLSGKIWQKITIVQNMTRMDPLRSSKQNTP